MSGLAGRALCWRLERRDGAGVALTSHDRAIVHGDLTYSPAGGISPGSVEKSPLDGRASEVGGAISDDALGATDLALGRWAGAGARLSVLRWDEASAEVVLAHGEIGEVESDGTRFRAELHGPAVRLSEPCCPTTSPHCRAELGDRQCRVDLAGRRQRFRVVAVEDEILVLDRPVGDGFRFGRIRLRSGAGCGLANLVLSISSDRVTCRQPWPLDIEPGAIVELAEGCDKRFETCRARFGNSVNFRGEPHLPGSDLLTRYPGI